MKGRSMVRKHMRKRNPKLHAGTTSTSSIDPSSSMEPSASMHASPERNALRRIALMQVWGRALVSPFIHPRVALQSRGTPGDISANLAELRVAAREAHAAGCLVLVTPELFLQAAHVLFLTPGGRSCIIE